MGESGCGKTTVGRLVLRLIPPTVGDIIFEGKDIAKLPEPDLKPFRRQMQIIFQDPFSSLDPRMPVGDSIGEGLRVHGMHSPRERAGARARRSCAKSGLEDYHARRYPHEFSGGQRQRIGIARALAAAAQVHRLRRARVGARRVHPGAGAQPACASCSATSG